MKIAHFILGHSEWTKDKRMFKDDIPLKLNVNKISWKIK